MSELRIGISGFSYPHWKGHFYPPGVKNENRLAFYAEHFDTVELNSTFYGTPKPAVLEGWKKKVPPGFLFAVKGSRLFTHYQHLRAEAEEVAASFRNVELLGDKLGPVFFQLPPDWPCDQPALASFLEMIPAGFRVAFEFRNQTWWTVEVYDLLSKHKAAFCIFDLKKKVSPLEITADFVYVRLHGPKRPYFDRYAEDVLKDWAKRVKAWRASGLDVYFYFNNTDEAAATKDALLLKQMLV